MRIYPAHSHPHHLSRDESQTTTRPHTSHNGKPHDSLEQHAPRLSRATDTQQHSIHTAPSSHPPHPQTAVRAHHAIHGSQGRSHEYTQCIIHSTRPHSSNGRSLEQIHVGTASTRLTGDPSTIYIIHAQHGHGTIHAPHSLVIEASARGACSLRRCCLLVREPLVIFLARSYISAPPQAAMAVCGDCVPCSLSERL